MLILRRWTIKTFRKNIKCYNAVYIVRNVHIKTINSQFTISFSLVELVFFPPRFTCLIAMWIRWIAEIGVHTPNTHTYTHTHAHVYLLIHSNFVQSRMCHLKILEETKKCLRFSQKRQKALRYYCLLNTLFAAALYGMNVFFFYFPSSHTDCW